jgi:hypothetical protein
LKRFDTALISAFHPARIFIIVVAIDGYASRANRPSAFLKFPNLNREYQYLQAVLQAIRRKKPVVKGCFRHSFQAQVPILMRQNILNVLKRLGKYVMSSGNSIAVSTRRLSSARYRGKTSVV